MKILVVGGGSGGHVTPVIAVLSEILRRQPDAEIRFWCDRKFKSQAEQLVHAVHADIPVSAIFSGKFRRYHTLPMWRQLLRPVSIVMPNIRDAVYLCVGVLESAVRLVMWRPDVVFLKGGYVSMPVGVVAHMLGIRLVLHDSDAHPGLTARVLSRWADMIGTGAPLENYPMYPTAKSRYVGIPISDAYTPQSHKRKLKLKQLLGVSEDRPLVVVTGGGLGARRLNDIVANLRYELFEICSVCIITGTIDYERMRSITEDDSQHYVLLPFVDHGMVDVLGAGDIVITRAGATTLLELAALAMPTIIVPNEYLTGGHQLKNAAVYAESGAALVADERRIEKDPHVLVDMVREIITHNDKALAMGRAFHAYAKPNAARDMANCIIETATIE